MFGGQYVAPALLPILRAVEAAHREACADPAFDASLNRFLHSFAGRPTPLQRADVATRRLGGATIYLKREDLSATGGSFANAAAGQCLLARRMGFRQVITDTGSGHHGFALAWTAAQIGLQCAVFMPETDARRQSSLVAAIRALGARVHLVGGAGFALHQAMSAAMQFWMAHGEEVFYVAGAPVGPHPYPLIVRSFQAVIGNEVRAQVLGETGRLPDALLASVGGGNAALGLFSAFLDELRVRLIAVEAGGTSMKDGEHAAKLTLGRPGVLHGAKTCVLQDRSGQILPTSSIAAGLCYPAVAPEIAWLHRQRRLESWVVRDHQAVDALRLISDDEGVRPSIETSHAVAATMQIARLLPPGATVVVPITSCGGHRPDDERNELRLFAAASE